jgi:uncharacterized protein
MKPPAALAALAALTVAFAATIAPAFAARSSYVVDDAHLLSPSAVAQINQQVSDFNAQTGKEVVVVTTPSLNGTSPDAAIERSFAQQQVNGVEILIAQNEHQIRIAGDVASRKFFPSGSFQTIAQSMRSSFKNNDYDGGVTNAVSLIINTYRGHEGSLRSTQHRQPVGAAGGGYTQRSQSGGFSMGWIWWAIILVVIFLVIRGIFRAMSGPRMMGGPGPGGYGGGPGYGPGYGGGMGMGGGGFWSGLLGGLGGAWLGNEIFGNRGGFGGGGYTEGGVAGTDPSVASDAGGWQSDAGQIDTSNIGGSSWGDSGGGDSGGGGWGGGDSGGGGGGGGDSGGGW